MKPLGGLQQIQTSCAPSNRRVNWNLRPLRQAAEVISDGDVHCLLKLSSRKRSARVQQSLAPLLKLIVLIFALMFTPRLQCAESVTLHLKNGDRVTGTISSEDTNLVVLTTPWANELQIPANQISKREPLAVVV